MASPRHSASACWPLSVLALVGALALGGWPAASTAVAQQQTDEARSAAARALFEEGIDFVENDEWDKALDRFRRALELRESDVLKFNLGQALLNTGRLVEGTEVLRQLVNDESVASNLQEMARQQLENLDPKLGELTIELTGEPQGAEITLDGQRLPQAVIGVRVPVDPGDHVIAAVRGGEPVAQQEIHIEESGSGEVTLEVPPPPPTPEDAARSAVGPPGSGGAEAEDDSIASSPWLWVGVGAVLVAAGAVTAALLLTGDDGGTGGQPYGGDVVWEF